MSAIGSLASGLLHAVLPTALFPGSTATSAGTNNVSIARLPDTGQVSSFGQLLSTLQQLQQSNTAQYQQVTQQIATNLQAAAQTAQSGGNTSAASQLNLLSTDFRNASATGQLPNIQDLATAVGGHRGYGNRLHGTNPDPDLQNGPFSPAAIISSALKSVP